jgi:hypothetical protein
MRGKVSFLKFKFCEGGERKLTVVKWRGKSHANFLSRCPFKSFRDVTPQAARSEGRDVSPDDTEDARLASPWSDFKYYIVGPLTPAFSPLIRIEGNI